jgi:hypothetical protein
MAKCRGITKDGTLCRNPVKRPGDRCPMHPYDGPPIKKGRRPIYRCQAPTKDKSPCRKRVSSEGERCARHLGMPSVKDVRKRQNQAKAALRQQLREERQSERLQRRRQHQEKQEQRHQEREHQLTIDAASYCSQAIQLGALDATEAVVADLVTQATWGRLTKNWSGGRCLLIAQMARQILEGKAKLHWIQGELVGRAVEWALRWTIAQELVQGLINSLPKRLGDSVENALDYLMATSIVRVFTRELVSKLPSPIDHPLIVAARSLQIVGIARCVALGTDVVNCACFRDLVNIEGKEFISDLIVHAEDRLFGVVNNSPS